MARGDLSAKSLETGLPVECRSLVRRDYRVVRWFMIAIAVLQAVYAVGFVFRSSVIVEGRRYFCLFDDAMISMRYADNWARGLGLVWNAGERVEGFTNLGWTLVMALSHLIPMSPSGHCLVVQLLGIPVLWACLLAVARLARACRLLPWAAVIAVALTATYYNLNFFTLMGMETGLFTALVTLGLADSVMAMRRRRGSAKGLLWFAGAGLVRPEACMLGACAFVFLLISVTTRRRRVLAGFVSVVLVQAALTTWRLWYYGEWLPNTVYLKATGWPLLDRLDPGVLQAVITVSTTALPLLLAAGVLLSSRRRHWLLLGTFAVALFYQTYMGGDAWPLNRFVIPAIGGIFVLAAQTIYHLPTMFKIRGGGGRVAALRVVVAALTVAATNAVHWDHCTFLTPPQTISDSRMNLRLWRVVDRFADPRASIAVVWAGTVPYYSRRPSFDLLGKCDPYISHLLADPVRPRAGHNKCDLEFSLSHHQPDVLLHMFSTHSVTFRGRYRPVSATIDNVPVAFCVRADSPYLRNVNIVDMRTAGRIMKDYEAMGSEQ